MFGYTQAQVGFSEAPSADVFPFAGRRGTISPNRDRHSMPFFDSRTAKDDRAAPLGRLELSVMEVVWSHGELTVRDVVARLPRPLAYTTVMTTLDRLFKKHLLDRRKEERAFRYSARLSRNDWERKRADNLLAGFLGGSQPSRELLISCLVEAVGQYDQALLDELEKKVRAKRRELLSRSGR